MTGLVVAGTGAVVTGLAVDAAVVTADFDETAVVADATVCAVTDVAAVVAVVFAVVTAAVVAAVFAVVAAAVVAAVFAVVAAAVVAAVFAVVAAAVVAAVFAVVAAAVVVTDGFAVVTADAEGAAPRETNVRSHFSAYCCAVESS